jgi:hypothetical protein
MGGGERRSTNEWCGGGDVRSRSNRNVGTPGAEECEDTRRAARSKMRINTARGRRTSEKMCASCFVFQRSESL